MRRCDSSTQDDHAQRYNRKQLGSEDHDCRNALGAFRKINDRKWDVSGLISSEQTITETTRDSMFTSGVIEGWKQFRQQHPHAGGYQAVSAVGFNTERTVAVVYSEVRCGAKCGTGGFTYFSRTPHGWSGTVSPPVLRTLPLPVVSSTLRRSSISTCSTPDRSAA